jgi:hypothetical protein
MVRHTGGVVVEGNTVAWLHWPWGRGKVRKHNVVGGGGG